MSSLVAADYGSDSDSCDSNQDNDHRTPEVCKTTEPGNPLRERDSPGLISDEDDDIYSTAMHDAQLLTEDSRLDNVAANGSTIHPPQSQLPQTFHSVTASDSDSSSSKDAATGSTRTSSAALTQPAAVPTLPSPFRTSVQSVFTNQYREAELAQTAILEQHVKLTEPTVKERKVVRKGKRKKGQQQGDVSKNSGQNSDGKAEISSNAVIDKTLPRSGKFQGRGRRNEFGDDNDDDGERVKRNKFRAGLSDSVTPSKRVFNAYVRQQAADKS